MAKKTYLCFVILIALFSFVLLPSCSRGDEPTVPLPHEEEEETEQEEEEEEQPPIVLKKVAPVMAIIDNHPQARPQSALQQATIVYEFLVEGGITRFLAVFDTLPAGNQAVGPIRSLRPYLARQAVAHGGIVAHGGYSSRTRDLIKGLPLRHVVSATYLWRDSSRKAPHNLYTSIEKLLEAAKHDGSFTEVIPSPPLLPPQDEEGTELTISYNRSNVVSYTHHQESNTYRRFVNDKPHTDRETGLQISAQRVILCPASHKAVEGTALLDIDLPRSGKGTLFESGRKYAITWKQEGGTTHYYYDNGNAVDLAYGNTWIQIIR